MKSYLTTISFCAILLLVVPIFVQAQGVDPCKSKDIICIPNPLQFDDIGSIITALTGLLRTIAISIGTIMIIVGGIQIMTGMMSGEKESKVVKGKKTLTYTIVGVAIVVLVDFIAGFVTELLTG